MTTPVLYPLEAALRAHGQVTALCGLLETDPGVPRPALLFRRPGRLAAHPKRPGSVSAKIFALALCAVLRRRTVVGRTRPVGCSAHRGTSVLCLPWRFVPMPSIAVLQSPLDWRCRGSPPRCH